MPLTRVRRLFGIAIVTQAVVLAGYGSAPQPITVIGKAADIVVLATATSLVIDQSTKIATVGLTISVNVKGQLAITHLQADLALPDNSLQSGRSDTVNNQALQASIVGSFGIWFLRLDPSGYHLIPFSGRWYSTEDLFLRQNSPKTPIVASGNLNQKLLAYIVIWYQGLSSPTLAEDTRLLSSFQSWNPSRSDVDPEDLLSAAYGLIGSVKLSQHAMGLCVAVKLGSETALSEVLAEVDTLKTSSKFGYLTSAISHYPGRASALPLFRQEIAMHTEAPGLDDAVASVLTRMMNNRDAIAVMAKMLHSRDETARLRAARFLSTYTFLADANGNLVEGAPDGPLVTAETRAFQPGSDPARDPSESYNSGFNGGRIIQRDLVFNAVDYGLCVIAIY